MDESGLGYLLGREKELIKTGGENVYPAEVDAVFAEMPEVADAGCCGVPDKKWGEAVTAVAALHEGKSLSLEELRAFAETQLAKYKLPLRLHIVEALPRNPAGKVLKFKLKEELS